MYVSSQKINNLRRAAKKGSTSTDTLADVTASSAAGEGGADQQHHQVQQAQQHQSQERERDVMDNDMDLNTETEVIKIHLEQLKKLVIFVFFLGSSFNLFLLYFTAADRDEIAFAEEERQYASEKAVHLKVFICFCCANSE